MITSTTRAARSQWPTSHVLLLASSLAMAGLTFGLGGARDNPMVVITAILTSVALIGLAAFDLSLAFVGYLVFLAWSPTFADALGLPTRSARFDEIVLLALVVMSLRRLGAARATLRAGRSIFVAASIASFMYLVSWIAGVFLLGAPPDLRDGLIVALSLKPLVIAFVAAIAWPMTRPAAPLVAVAVAGAIPAAVGWLQLLDDGRMNALLATWYPNQVVSSRQFDPEYLRVLAHYRAYSVFWGDPNSFGVFEAVCSLIALFVAARAKGIASAAALILSAVAATGVVISGSRAGLVVLVVSVALAALRSSRVFAFLVGVLLAFGALAAVLPLPDTLAERWQEFNPLDLAFGPSLEREFAQKLSFEVALVPSDCSQGYQADDLVGCAVSIMLGRGPSSASGFINDIWYLQLYVQRGLVGTLLVIALSATALFVASLARAGPAWVRVAATTEMICVPLLLVAGVSGNYLFGTRILEVVWAVLGFTIWHRVSAVERGHAVVWGLGPYASPHPSLTEALQRRRSSA